MIRYSTQPSADAKAILNTSPTSKIITTDDVMGLNDDDNKSQNTTALLDLDAEDDNE
jgi:hypothetical protein